MVRRALIVLCVGFMCIFAASCGQTFELQAITVTPSSPNVEGIGGTQSLAVTAHYSNTKTADVTAHTTYDTSQLPNTITLSEAGTLEAVGADCTWTAEPTDSPTDSKFSYATNPYTVVASYTENGVTKTFQVFVNIDSIGGCYDGQAFPAPTGFTGN